MNENATSYSPAADVRGGPGPERRRSRLPRSLQLLFANKLALFGIVFLIIVTATIVAEPWLPLHSPTRMNLANQFAPPSAEHWLGTDENGRDVFARLIVGGRISLAVGLIGAVLTVLFASFIGVLSGYFGGTVDHVLMRLTDGFMAIPTFFLLMIIVAIWGSSAVVLVLALALTRWMGVARLVRSEVLRFKNMEFVTAARSVGASNLRIMWKHLLPQAMPSLIVATSINVGIVMLIEAGLSFLGLGILPPTPSWGNMLTASQYYMWMSPHLAVYPGLMILLSVLAFNSLGDVLRDILDPRQRGSR